MSELVQALDSGSELALAQEMEQVTVLGLALVLESEMVTELESVMVMELEWVLAQVTVSELGLALE